MRRMDLFFSEKVLCHLSFLEIFAESCKGIVELDEESPGAVRYGSNPALMHSQDWLSLELG